MSDCPIYQGLRQEAFGRRFMDESDLHKVKVKNIHKLMQQSCLRKLELDENMSELFYNEEYLSQRPELELEEDTDEENSDSGLERVQTRRQEAPKRKRGGRVPPESKKAPGGHWLISGKIGGKRLRQRPPQPKNAISSDEYEKKRIRVLLNLFFPLLILHGKPYTKLKTR